MKSIGRHRPPSGRLSRGLTAGLFIAAGLLHFVRPAAYRQIIPPQLPWPGTLVFLSGLAEIAGGVGLLIPPLRRPAGWGLVALLIAVFPANLFMAVRADRFADWGVPTWLLWMRLPLQGVLIAWVLHVSKRETAGPSHSPSLQD